MRRHLPLAVGGAAIAVMVGVGALWLALSPARARAAADFELTDHRGDTVSLRDLRGHPAVVTFVYTRCPDVCPVYLGQISDAVSRSGPWAGVSVAVITVDPARDTVEHLATFARSWPAQWYFLTGREIDLARAWSAYGVEVESDGGVGQLPGSSYSVAHTGKTLIIDRDGYVAAELRGRWETSDLVDALRQATTKTTASSRPGAPQFIASLAARCGDFASAQPWAFAGLVALIMLPGLALPAYLLVNFLRTPAGTGARNGASTADAPDRHHPPVA